MVEVTQKCPTATPPKMAKWWSKWPKVALPISQTDKQPKRSYTPTCGQIFCRPDPPRLTTPPLVEDEHWPFLQQSPPPSSSPQRCSAMTAHLVVRCDGFGKETLSHIFLKHAAALSGDRNTRNICGLQTGGFHYAVFSGLRALSLLLLCFCAQLTCSLTLYCSDPTFKDEGNHI